MAGVSNGWKKNRHQPGRDNDSHESKQHAEVGKRTKAAAPKVGQFGMRGVVVNLEKKLSISASKYRERGRSSKL